METLQTQSASASRLSNPPPPLPFVPDALIVEILSWLPVKSLLQFRCVCKLWKSVISDPNFVKLHLHRSGTARKANLLLNWSKHYGIMEYVHCVNHLVPCSVNSLVDNPSYTIDEDNCYTLNNNNGYIFLGSSNGLVCLFDYFDGDKFVEYCFYLCNPATKLTLKKLTCLRGSDYCYRFAFGYDKLSDTYKVLAFTFGFEAKEESKKTLVKIFSLGDNCWRSIRSFPVVPLITLRFPRQNDGVHFNGTLNWLALCNNNSGAYEWDDTITMAQLVPLQKKTMAQLVIVSLDLGMETYTQLLLPRLDEAPHVEPTIGVLMDCLCFSHDCMRTHFVVWQMKEFGVQESWTQFVRVSYQDLQIDCFDFPLPLSPICVSENGDVLIMASPFKCQAILYHRRDNRAEQTELPTYINWENNMDYVESLVWP